MTMMMKGAVRYAEIDQNGNIVADLNDAAVGTLYIRKTALNGGGIPQTITVSVEYDA